MFGYGYMQNGSKGEVRPSLKKKKKKVQTSTINIIYVIFFPFSVKGPGVAGLGNLPCVQRGVQSLGGQDQALALL